MNIAETWTVLVDDIDAPNRRLISELRAAWESLDGLIDRQIGTLERISALQTNKNLQTLEAIFGSHAFELLLQPVAEYRRSNPQQRVLNAFDDYDRTVEDILRAMPEFVTVSGLEWTETIGTAGLSLRNRTLPWMRSSGRRVVFRQNLLHGFRVEGSKRKVSQGRLMQALAEMTLEVLTPWQSMLQFWLPLLLQETQQGRGPTEEARTMRARRGRYSRHAARALSELESWVRRHPSNFANRSPMSTRPPKRAVNPDNDLVHQRFWRRQIRAVDAHVDIHTRLAAAETAVLASAGNMLESLQEEHRALLKELDAVVSWLRNSRPHEPSAFPPAQAEIVAATARLSAWKQTVERIFHQVPESIEVSSRAAALPRLRPAWKPLAPRSIVQESFEKEGVAITRDGLEQLAQQHQSIIREIEKAREVVAFALESSRTDKPTDDQVEQEGFANALSLLEFHRELVQELPPGVEFCFVAALSATLLRTHTVLTEGQLGLLRQTARYGIPSTARAALRLARNRSRAATQHAARIGSTMFREGLIRIGWISPPTTRVPPVIAREYLSHQLGGGSRLDQLPMIYQRLFRVAPVEDPRFLIGRQEELAALAEAQRLWEKGHNAAALIVGERGSGKTSLINCALQSGTTDAEVVRGEFSGRMTQHHEMYEFLAHLIGVDSGSLESTLLSVRRVIVLEEMERTFLRRIQHYGAIRSLMNLISKTSGQNLWIVSANYFAFRFLNAAIRLDPHFSHRINAMAVDPSHLKEAILMRHHLSGLRLQFAPRPEAKPYAERLRKMAGIESDPEDEFFDLLHRESGGVFRSAFSLWLRYIERAEAGVLYLRYPATTQLEGVVKGLNDVDMLTLTAILQHGSLTPLEHSIIFRIDEAISNAWMDNLLARELVEPDPGHEGLRVVPEAGEIVRQTLFQRNLG